MDLIEIESNLPNGFHDSQLLSFAVDHERNTAVLKFNIDISDSDGDGTFLYRKAEISFASLLYFAVEPPSVDFANEYGDGPNVQDICSDSSDFSLLKHEPKLPKLLPDGYFAHWFYAGNDNNFIYLAAKNADLRWLD